MRKKVRERERKMGRKKSKEETCSVEGQIRLKIMRARSRLFILATIYIGGFIQSIRFS
jgi:hypothetical protein